MTTLVLHSLNPVSHVYARLNRTVPRAPSIWLSILSRSDPTFKLENLFLIDGLSNLC